MRSHRPWRPYRNRTVSNGPDGSASERAPGRPDAGRARRCGLQSGGGNGKNYKHCDLKRPEAQPRVRAPVQRAPDVADRAFHSVIDLIHGPPGRSREGGAPVAGGLSGGHRRPRTAGDGIRGARRDVEALRAAVGTGQEQNAHGTGDAPVAIVEGVRRHEPQGASQALIIIGSPTSSLACARNRAVLTRGTSAGGARKGLLHRPIGAEMTCSGQATSSRTDPW